MHAFQAVGKLRDGAASLAAAGTGVAFKEMGESLVRTAAGVPFLYVNGRHGRDGSNATRFVNANISSVGYAAIGTTTGRNLA
jgi:hypothetical protein